MIHWEPGSPIKKQFLYFQKHLQPFKCFKRYYLSTLDPKNWPSSKDGARWQYFKVYFSRLYKSIMLSSIRLYFFNTIPSWRGVRAMLRAVFPFESSIKWCRPSVKAKPETKQIKQIPELKETHPSCQMKENKAWYFYVGKSVTFVNYTINLFFITG